MANFDINVFIIAREKFVLNRPGTVRCPADLLQRRPGSVRHRTVPGRTSADVFIYRRRPAPVRYVTTQEKILKNRPAPGRLSNSPVMCKSLKSYDVSFICDHSINKYHFKLLSLGTVFVSMGDTKYSSMEIT